MKKENQRIAVDGFKTFLEEKLKPRFGADQIEMNNKAARTEAKKLINSLRANTNNDIQISHATIRELISVVDEFSYQLKALEGDKKLKDHFSKLEIPKEIEPLISTKEAAKLLGVSRKTITNWISNKKLTRVDLNKDNDKKAVYKVKADEIREIIAGIR